MLEAESVAIGSVGSAKARSIRPHWQESNIAELTERMYQVWGKGDSLYTGLWDETGDQLKPSFLRITELKPEEFRQRLNQMLPLVETAPAPDSAQFPISACRDS